MVSSSTDRTQTGLDRGAYLCAKSKNNHNWFFRESGHRSDMVSAKAGAEKNVSALSEVPKLKRQRWQYLAVAVQLGTLLRKA